MGAIGFFTAVVLCGLIVALTNWWDKRKEEKDEQRITTSYQDAAARQIMKESFDKSNVDKEKGKEVMNSDNQSVGLGTRDLFMETLTKIGCQYELAEEENDDRIFFAYQGEHFFVNASNDWQYIQIFDTHWGHVELYDVDEFSRLRKAINESNLNNSVTTVYTIDEAGSNVDVHSKTVIPFISQIPEIDNYLRGELNEFFRAHQFVSSQMVKLREREESIKS